MWRNRKTNQVNESLILSHFEKICEKYNETIIKYKRFSDFLKDIDNDSQRRTGHGSYFDLVEAEIFEDERRNNELLFSLEQITENLEIIIEKKAVFDKCVQLLESPEMRSTNVSNNSMEEAGIGANFLAGTIKAEDELRMKRMIFRVSRGRAIPSFFNLEHNPNEDFKSVKFILINSLVRIGKSLLFYIRDQRRIFCNKNWSRS